MGGDVYWDVDLAWDVSDTLSVTFGGNYVFDAAPDPPPEFLMLLWRSYIPQLGDGLQGPYYYVRGVLRWN